MPLITERNMTNNKSCFIIMPISDNPNYPVGHFKRVYEYIIKPSCIKAGFTPIRADEVAATNYIALDIVKRIIEADLAICDLSSQNPNVLYELGVRQAFNKPVVLIKDNATKRIFDIQGFRDVEYDSNLRIDNVDIAKDMLANAIISTYESKGTEINSLITMLGIVPAEVTESTKISLETELVLNQLDGINNRLSNLEDRLSYSAIKASDSDVGSTQDLDFKTSLKLEPGDRVIHERFGVGTVLKVELSKLESDTKIEIRFDVGGIKRLLLRFIKLRKIIPQSDVIDI